jgi:MFS family permease
MSVAREEPGIGLRLGRALRSRNYRLFFSGQAISLLGTWMQNLALSWLVYRLTNSPFMLGLVNFAGDIPTFFLMPFAGVFADRFNKHRIIVATQTLAMVQAFILGALVLTGAVKIWHLVLLNALLGVVNAFDMPTRQAFVVEMIEAKEDLPNAIALNSSVFNAARLLGPAVAGLLIAAVGEGYCFIINGASFIAVIAALLAMRIKERPIPASVKDSLRLLKEGFAYTFGFMPIRSIISLLALVSLMGMSYTTLMPVVAKTILHGGPRTLGFLMGAAGAGAFTAAIYLAARKSVLGLGRMIPLAAGMFSLGLVALSFSHHFLLALAFMPLIGFGLMTQMASSNTVIQTIVDDDKRGRVMAIYAMAFRGIAPFSALFAGALASRIGTLATLKLGGIICGLGAVWFATKLKALRKIVRPIYARHGIIPEVAAGLKAATDFTPPPEDRTK